MKKITIFILALLFSAAGFTQTIHNISPHVVGNKIRIDFKLSGLKYYQDVSGLSVFVKMGEGAFKGPMKQITGNTKGFKNGYHSIYWDVLKEMPFTDEEMVFDVHVNITDKDRRRKFFVALTGNDVTPLGLRFGQLGKTAWYVEARASLLARETPGYTYLDSTITDYDKPGYYETTGTGGWQAYSAVVGITQQVTWNTFLYFGAGYGVENYIMEINEHDYTDETVTGTDWTKYDAYSNSGVEIDAGLLLRFNHLLISAGGTALNFKSFGWTVSVGVSF